jgi:phenylpyruvate tautomerase PptA (4-oxalocrotonate tautomerase family)
VSENTTGVLKSLIETRNKRAEQAFWNAGQRLDYTATAPLHYSTPHMPTYTVTVANLSLTTEQENSIAGAITESHHLNTGAPGFFAQVLFNAIAAGKHFVGGKDLSNIARVRARVNPRGTQCGCQEESRRRYCKKGR